MIDADASRSVRRFAALTRQIRSHVGIDVKRKKAKASKAVAGWPRRSRCGIFLPMEGAEQGSVIAQLIATKLAAEPARVLQTLRANAIAASCERIEDRYLEHWHQLVNQSPTEIVDALHSADFNLGWLIDADLLKDVLTETELSTAREPSRVDRLVLGTVNASTSNAVTAREIVTWIRCESTHEAKQRVALSTFFFEVPLDAQVAFLVEHQLDEEKALAFARRLEQLSRTIPLERRSRW